ncbi:MAG: hypothetical protein LBP89_08550 [Helicobacteraceae bacterium]|jgi:hypothetical protein|nr:hypothetical protein [Helicobacteraceae bacterium]
MNAYSFIAALFYGFAIGFVCWKGSFLLVKPIASKLCDLERLEPIAVKCVYAIVFVFLAVLTAMLLTILPIGVFVFNGAKLAELYLLSFISFSGSFFGYLFLLYLRWISGYLIRLNAKIEKRRLALKTGRKKG